MPCLSVIFLFNDIATTEIYTLSLHVALPSCNTWVIVRPFGYDVGREGSGDRIDVRRSEEHTSELQSRGHLVCRLLLEKKKKKQPRPPHVDCANLDARPSTTNLHRRELRQSPQ